MAVLWVMHSHLILIDLSSSPTERHQEQHLAVQYHADPPCQPLPFGTGFGKGGPAAICHARAFSY